MPPSEVTRKLLFSALKALPGGEPSKEAAAGQARVMRLRREPRLLPETGHQGLGCDRSRPPSSEHRIQPVEGSLVEHGSRADLAMLSRAFFGGEGDECFFAG